MLAFQYVAIIYFTFMAGYSVIKKEQLNFMYYAFLTLTLEILMLILRR